MFIPPLDPLRPLPKYLATASRIAVSDATTGSTCSPVMNFTSSIAKMFVGSVIASVSVVPIAADRNQIVLGRGFAGHQPHDRRVQVVLREIDGGHAVLAAQDRRDVFVAENAELDQTGGKTAAIGL